MNGEFLAPIGGALAVASVAAAVGMYYTKEAVADHERRAKESEHAAALKRHMVDKGFTADDIIRVVEARPVGDAGKA